ncbi:DUF7555 family protein [Halocatena pleomorpha]|uniref:Uncharacterized protein n=1 Tax=Halocatena pleomorpha TaxID=1785090 RepID=A0A3P3R6S0_9EURY|nr:hypothetical protein [Halocatena pleomorpha]RRJ29147.1 hypothetical protein EIK79_13490 [Halocatena pleomorpha]
MNREPSIRVQQAVDAFVYAVAVTTIALVSAVIVSFALGGGWVGVKFILFLIGIGLFGVGTFALRPTPPWRDHSRLPTPDRSVLQSRLQRLPPLDAYGLTADERFPTGAKLLLSSVFILALSFVLETVFGVAR